MRQAVMHIFTRTPLHVGAGNSVGAVDSPVMRERHTGFPVIPGSSIKGVLRDHLQELGNDEIDKAFGKGGDDMTAGALSFGEARLLLFPVRSAKGAFALATCALAMSRFARDAEIELQVPSNQADMTCLAGNDVVLENNGKTGVVLEEYKFERSGAFPEEWSELLSNLLNDSVLKAAKGRFVMLSDGDFAHFAVNACQVNQHVRINPKTGTAQRGGLFNEETVPAETLFYSVINDVRGLDSEAVFEALSEERLIQFGGNGTTGLGFCTVKLQA